MSILEAIILGIVQGLTEFLPVSSSGHLVLLQGIFGVKEGNLLFDVILHLGTLVAVLVVYRRDILDLIKRPFSRLTLLLITGTIPTVIVALLFKEQVEAAFDTGATLAYGFIATGILLWYADGFKRGSKDISTMKIRDSVWIGLMQGIALLPAVSRSGMTIIAALLAGVDRKVAAKYSFLLSIPAILGALVLQVKDFIESGQSHDIHILQFTFGGVAAALSGYLAIRIMLKIIGERKLKIFSIYLWILGFTTFILQYIGRI